MNDFLYSVSKEIPGRRIILRYPEEGDGAMVYEAVVESLDDLRRWPASLPWAVQEPTLDTSEIFCRRSQAELIERKRLPYLVLDAATHSFIGCMGVNRIETQEEIVAMLQADYEAWVQYMKDAGAWHGE